MSNKTSDENVVNIEDDVELVKRYLENSAYKESESNFFKNGGWEMVDLEIPKAMANILAEREQKDKRIQDLERKNKHLSNTSDYETISLECTHLEEQLDIANSRIQELEEENRIFVLEGSKVRLEQYIKENFIPKQVVIDKMKELNKEMRSCDEIDAIFKIKQQQILAELLEGEK